MSDTPETPEEVVAEGLVSGLDGWWEIRQHTVGEGEFTSEVTVIEIGTPDGRQLRCRVSEVEPNEWWGSGGQYVSRYASQS
jgi:hypothetical protein